ncbi:MAG TPA: hypothetical protein VHV76_10120 [Mycobacteriales bacterium]|jgi:hypothetical protein|nr:hypothetical protein [Mycobacteriales bacterium]
MARPTDMVRATWLAVLPLGATLLAGCSGEATGSSHPDAAFLIRGTQIPTYSCAATSAGLPITVAPSIVMRIRLCPLRRYPKPSPAVSVNRTDPRFAVLAHALSVPDEKAPGAGFACAEYANLPQPVIGETAAGPFLIHIPVDGCGHYLSTALSAISALRPQA